MAKRGRGRGRGAGRPRTNTPWAQPGQAYGVAVAALGSCRFTVRFDDGAERTCRVCGHMRSRRNRAYVRRGDLVLASLRDFEDKADIVYAYDADEKRMILRDFAPGCAFRRLAEGAVDEGADAGEDGAVDVIFDPDAECGDLAAL
jgi:initiation factor 1A